MKRYKLALKSDTGLVYVSTMADNEEQAKYLATTRENAPLRAVKWCKEDTRKFWIEKEYAIFRRDLSGKEVVCSYSYTIEGQKQCREDLKEYRNSGDREGSYTRRVTYTRHPLALPA